jgi:hypothetical protein
VSTLRVDAIQNRTGGDLVTAKGMARAWVNFNGSGTVSIRTSFNVSSITDNGTGEYTVNFTTAMSDSDYAWAGSAEGDGNTNNGAIIGHGPTGAIPVVKSTTQLKVVVQNDSASFKDSSRTSVIVFD